MKYAPLLLLCFSILLTNCEDEETIVSIFYPGDQAHGWATGSMSGGLRMVFFR